MIATNREKLNSVVLIDDNEIDNFLHRKILENCGATNILSFISPLTALEYFTQLTNIPQLILLDINFPIMNGFEFLEEFSKLEIAQHHNDIFILSATSNPTEIKKSNQKCSGFIEKFLTKEKLFAQLGSLYTLDIKKTDKQLNLSQIKSKESIA